MKRFATLLLLTILTQPTTAMMAMADPGPDYLPGPWHYKAMSCVDTRVTFVGPRLGYAGQKTFTAQNFKDTGVVVTYATGLGMQPLFPKVTASIVHYQGEATNAIMEAERAGDLVQVCYLGGPAPETRCDPDKDERGRQYRVWDYRQKKQYWGYNSEHVCGGA